MNDHHRARRDLYDLTDWHGLSDIRPGDQAGGRERAGQKEHRQPAAAGELDLQQGVQIRVAAVFDQRADGGLFGGGPDTAGRAHRDAQHTDAPRLEPAAKQVIDGAEHVPPFQLPKGEAARPARAVTTQINHQNRKAARVHRFREFQDFALELAGAAAAHAVDEDDCPGRFSGGDVPGRDRDRVDAGRKRHRFEREIQRRAWIAF